MCVRVCVYVCVCLVAHSLPEHGDLVLDAAFLPLQSLLRDALHGEHPAGQLLLSQDHLGKCSSINT